MRAAFIRILINRAKADKRIYLLVGDVGFSLVEPFAKKFPERFINVGIAEQNMIGVACGMALSGKIVFIYSLTNFPTLRCFEQIRNDICYHNANVKIVTAGSGFTYGTLGVTHHTTEDLAIMRALPNMTVISPGDPVESELAMRAVINQKGPCYLRLQKTGDPLVYKNFPKFKIGRAITVRKGNDITLIATGGILYNTVRASELLAQRGINARVLSMHTVNPLDKKAILTAARQTNIIMTIEEHRVIGGLGSAVAEVLAETKNLKFVFRRIGIDNKFDYKIGTQEYLRKKHSLSIEGIAKAALGLLHDRRG